MIEVGSRVLLVDDRGGKHMLKAERGMQEVRRLGAVDGTAICEAGYGGAVVIAGRRFMVLRPSLQDILSTLERKAQIISPKDGFQIPMRLDIGCGSRVIEGGVGSGALTIVLLRAVAPEGRVFSYDVRDDHFSTARRNVAMAGLESCWECRNGDVRECGLEKGVDAAVLDIPDPWEAVANVISALRTGGYLCCYVPNTNQVERTVRAMEDRGMSEVFAFETIQREMVVHSGGVRPSFENLGHTGYLIFARKIEGE